MTTTADLLQAMLDTATAACHEIVEAAQAGNDELDDGTNIWEYPLEVVNEPGRPYAVVLGTGGPHIEVTAYGLADAALHGYWGSDHFTRHDDIFDAFLGVYINRDE